MKAKYQIPAKAAKPKRGTEFNYNGHIVYLCRIKENGEYFICHSKEMHPHDEYLTVQPYELAPVQKSRVPIRSKAKALTDDDIAWNKSLNAFFLKMALKCPQHCENCGTPLNAFTLEAKRFVTAHILPKSRKYGFPEVATDEFNIIFLGVFCGCHYAWDNLDSNTRIKMPVWGIAIERYWKFKHKLTPKKQLKADQYLSAA